jgi:hypothetical protein
MFYPTHDPIMWIGLARSDAIVTELMDFDKCVSI